MPNYREIFRQAAEERNSRELEAQAAKYRPQRISIKGEGIISRSEEEKLVAPYKPFAEKHDADIREILQAYREFGKNPRLRLNYTYDPLGPHYVLTPDIPPSSYAPFWGSKSPILPQREMPIFLYHAYQQRVITDRSNPFIFWELKDVIYVFLFLREWEVTRWLFRKDKVIEPDEVGILHHMGDLTTELFETSYHNNSMDKLAKILSGQASYTNSSYNGFIRSKRFSKSSEYSNDYYRSSSWEGNSSRR